MNSAYDDQGSVATAAGGGYTVVTGTKKNPHGDREGTYSINGYTLVLRYDNGIVARLPFFFGDKTRDTLWFEGSRLELNEGRN